jgi:hypothetical protein
MNRFVPIAVACCLLAASSWAGATNYPLWINGRTGGGVVGNYASFTYWGGASGSGGGSYCNPSDWFCNDLALGTAANEGGSTKWNYHSVSFCDDAEAYNHDAGGNWHGIVGVVRAAVASSAL